MRKSNKKKRLKKKKKSKKNRRTKSQLTITGSSWLKEVHLLRFFRNLSNLSPVELIKSLGSIMHKGMKITNESFLIEKKQKFPFIFILFDLFCLTFDYLLFPKHERHDRAARWANYLIGEF